MWIRKADFMSLVRELETERRRADVALVDKGRYEDQVAALSKRNLELQDALTAMRHAPPQPPLTFDDPLDEDPEDVARVLAEIKQHGRDVVLMREARNEQ